MRLRVVSRFVYAGFAVTMLTLFGCSRRDAVDVAFHDVMKRYEVFRNHTLLCSSRDWFRAYRVDEADIEGLLGCDLSDFGYVGWERFQGRRSCGVGPALRVDGIRNHVMWNRTFDSDDFDMEAVFLDLDAKILILYYGRTYGM